MVQLLRLEYDKADILLKRKQAGEMLMKCSDNIHHTAIKKISAEDVRKLFYIYDEVFFDNYFKKEYEGRMKFELSRRMTRSAGMTVAPRNIDRMDPKDVVITIKIGIDFIMAYGMDKKCNMVGGIRASNSLEALQIILEHEICHVIEFLAYGHSNCRLHAFKVLSNNLFGHTEGTHGLLNLTKAQLKEKNICIGMKVAFEYNNTMLKGVVYSINKNVMVMVECKSGKYIDKSGVRYEKYYVPVEKIRA